MEACCLECAVANNRAGDLIWDVAMAAGFGLNFNQRKPARVTPTCPCFLDCCRLATEDQRGTLPTGTHRRGSVRRWALSCGSRPQSSRSCSVKLHSRFMRALHRIRRCSLRLGAISGLTLRTNRQDQPLAHRSVAPKAFAIHLFSAACSWQMAAKIQAKKETLVLRIGLTGMSVNVVTHDKVRFRPPRVGAIESTCSSTVLCFFPS